MQDVEAHAMNFLPTPSLVFVSAEAAAGCAGGS
jgi:hypothetical protein